MDAVFEALGDATRRLILRSLAAGEQPAGAVVAALQARGPISQPTVSQHLRVLREAGLVAVRAEGTRRLYSIDPSGL
ncbi:winged helix-turn-helix transcriptional regulator, partial [Motilibacter sp. E257]|nr:winged helix-turn-helix transcriptional regulator [Motilibacter deserti]